MFPQPPAPTSELVPEPPTIILCSVAPRPPPHLRGLRSLESLSLAQFRHSRHQNLQASKVVFVERERDQVFRGDRGGRREEFGGCDGAAEEAVLEEKRGHSSRSGAWGWRHGPGPQTTVLRVEESSERMGSTGACLRERRVSSRFCHM